MSANESFRIVRSTIIVESASKALRTRFNVVYTYQVRTFARHCSDCSRVGVLKSPGFSLVLGSLEVLLVVISNRLVKRIFKVRVGHESLDREKYRSNLESRRPFILENVEADTSELVNVGVVDLGTE